jgi:uncharacterized protein
MTFVKPFYESPDPAHDWPHIGRVVATARKLCRDQKVNEELVLAAVYCHDIVNLPKNHPDRSKASTLSAERAADFLKQCDYSDEEIEIVKRAVVEHSFSKGLRPSCLEAAILQDADRLDALGAIGVLRCAAVNTQMQSSFYDPFDPLAEHRELNDKSFMLDHYFVKLFKLPAMMNTEAARQEGERRVEVMKKFIQNLMNEVKA